MNEPWDRAEAERKCMERLIAAARQFVRTAEEFWPDYPPAVAEAVGELDSALGNLVAIQHVDELREALRDTDFVPILPAYEV